MTEISVIYRNWRGEVGQRRILPRQIEFKATEWHPEPQWIMHAWDLDKKEWRDFALKDMDFASSTQEPKP